MRPLSGGALKRIREYDWVAVRSRGRANRYRFYKYLTRSGADVEVRTVCVKTRKDGSAAIKEVVRASADGKKMEVKDVVFSGMCGYVCDWSPEKLGRKMRHWSYSGKWMPHNYVRRDRLFKLRCPTVNPELLKRTRRWKWCAWNEGCGDVLDYLKFYLEHPRIELLAKCGAGRFALLSGFVRQLETDKGFMRFFTKNLAEIVKGLLKVDVIRMAYGRGMTLAEAERRTAAVRRFGGIPEAVDAERAAAYVGKAHITDGSYMGYLKGCERLGMDLADTKNAFPKVFEAREKDVLDGCAALARREAAALAAKMDAALAAVADRFLALEKLRGRWLVKIPRREKDLRTEGKRLEHCAGNYAGKVARGEVVLAFIRKKDRPRVPFVTVSYCPGKGEIGQCYGKRNSKPEKGVLDFVRGRFLEAARLVYAGAEGDEVAGRRDRRGGAIGAISRDRWKRERGRLRRGMLYGGGDVLAG